MAAMCCLKSTPPSFATREGLVVTPSAMPSDAASRISLRFAVSIKNFISTSFVLYEQIIGAATSKHTLHERKGSNHRLNRVVKHAHAFNLYFDHIARRK